MRLSAAHHHTDSSAYGNARNILSSGTSPIQEWADAYKSQAKVFLGKELACANHEPGMLNITITA